MLAVQTLQPRLHSIANSDLALQMLAVLRPLQPRLYSISTSQLEAATRVGVTVAVVRYESLGRQRIGVTSTYTAERMQVCF